jgi:hypothetical protein
MLTKILWREADPSDRKKAQYMMEKLVQNRFDKFYRPSEGGFAYYPDAKRASLDGTGTALYLLENVGALSDQKRTALWGTPSQTMAVLGERIVPEMSKDDMKALNAAPGINSIRIYSSLPKQNVDTGILYIVYPRVTKVLDAADLLPPGDYELVNRFYFVNETPPPLRPVHRLIPQPLIAWAAEPAIALDLGPFDRVIDTIQVLI